MNNISQYLNMATSCWSTVQFLFAYMGNIILAIQSLLISVGYKDRYLSQFSPVDFSRYSTLYIHSFQSRACLREL